MLFYQRLYKIFDMGNCNDQKSVDATVPISHQPIPPSVNASPIQQEQEYDTVVVGGGISGVAAAVELAKAGQRVAVIEANQYLGGRMKTIGVRLQSENTVQFDEGASWIHGSGKQNPITQLSKSVKGLVIKETDDQSLQVFDEQGEAAGDETLKAFEQYEAMLQQAEKHDRSESLEQVFKNGQENFLLNKYFMYNVSNDLQFQTSGPINRLSAKGLDDDQFEGKEDLILSGYQKFVETLATQAQFDLSIGQRVKQISYNDEKNKVVCENGTTIYATNVIISIPIGVLKAKGVKFQPNLPAWKNEAINNIGFGNVCKILLDFIKPINFPESHYIGVVSDDISKRGLGTYFLNLQNIAGVPALMTFGLGSNADDAQKMSQSALKDFLVKRINTFSPTQITSADFNLYRTSWKANNNFKGTYAYGAVETRAEDWQNMAKPVFDSSWYFCGEHTTSKYRGTVHGAYFSGIEAAKDIIKQTNEDNWVYPDNESESESSKKDDDN